MPEAVLSLQLIGARPIRIKEIFIYLLNMK